MKTLLAGAYFTHKNSTHIDHWDTAYTHTHTHTPQSTELTNGQCIYAKCKDQIGNVYIQYTTVNSLKCKVIGEGKKFTFRLSRHHPSLNTNHDY